VVARRARHRQALEAVRARIEHEVVLGYVPPRSLPAMDRGAYGCASTDARTTVPSARGAAARVVLPDDDLMHRCRCSTPPTARAGTTPQNRVDHVTWLCVAFPPMVESAIVPPQFERYEFGRTRAGSKSLNSQQALDRTEELARVDAE